MRIEGSSISCGVRRLVIDKNDKPTKDDVAKLISANKSSCAIVMAGVPSKDKEIILSLLDNGFERVRKTVERVDEPSIFKKFADMAFSILHHDHEPGTVEDLDEGEDDATRFEQYVGSTVSSKLKDFASLVIHHGDAPRGNNKFFIRYMDK